MKRFILLFLCISMFAEQHITIICASYKNARWYKQNLDSMLGQKYENYHIIYIDDNSPDNTGQLVEHYLENHPKKDKVTLIQNQSRMGALYNQYHAIHSCANDTIIIICDGDDWFAHQNVLSRINQIYENNDIWLTYGQFRYFPSGRLGLAKPIAKWVIEKNAFRNYQWVTTHLRTFYAGLFKKIKREDLEYKGTFFAVAPDMPVMLCMIEMARDHFRFVPEVLYIYNNANPINENKINRPLIKQIDQYVRRQKRYEKLTSLF